MDLNEVDERDLRVPGIGEITAKRIVDRREELGYFKDWSNLQGIPYLGPVKMRSLLEHFYVGTINPDTSCYIDYSNHLHSATAAAPPSLTELPGSGESKNEIQVSREAQHPNPKSRFPNKAQSERQNFEEERLGKMDLNEVDERDLRVPGIGEITAKRILDRREELGYFKDWSDLQGIPYLGPVKMRSLLEHFYIGTINPGTSYCNDYPNKLQSSTAAASPSLAELPGSGESKNEIQVSREAQHPNPKSRFPNKAQSERQNFEEERLGKMDLNEVDERDLRVPGIGEITAKRILDRREELGYFKDWSNLQGIPYLGPVKMRSLLEHFYIGTINPGTSYCNDYPNKLQSSTAAAPPSLSELPGSGESKNEIQVSREAQHPNPKSRFPNKAQSERQNFEEERLGKMDLNEVDERDLRVPGIGEITAKRIVDRREELGYFKDWSDLQGIPYLGSIKTRILTKNFYIGAINPGTSCYIDNPNKLQSSTAAAPPSLSELPGSGESKNEIQVSRETQRSTPKSRFPNKVRSERQNFKTVKRTIQQNITQPNLDEFGLNTAREREILNIPGIECYTIASKILARRKELGHFHWSDLESITYLNKQNMKALKEHCVIFTKTLVRNVEKTKQTPLIQVKPTYMPSHNSQNLAKTATQHRKQGKMDLNEVDERDLRVRGIGEITAERIVDLREELGYFKDWSDLQRILYLGPQKMKILTEHFYISRRHSGTSYYNDCPNKQRSSTAATPPPLAELPGLRKSKNEIQVSREAQHPTPKSKLSNKAQNERQKFKTVKQSIKQNITQPNLDKLDLNAASEKEILNIHGIEYYTTASKIVDRRKESGYFTQWSDLESISYLTKQNIKALKDHCVILGKTQVTNMEKTKHTPQLQAKRASQDDQNTAARLTTKNKNANERLSLSFMISFFILFVFGCLYLFTKIYVQ